MGTHRLATHGETVNMKFFGILSTVLASAAAQYPIGYAGYGAPLGYAGVPIHTAAQQSGNALTGVQGSYSFRDEAGLHTISYVADALGYRVTGRSRRSVPVAPIAPIGYAGIAAPIDAAAYAAGPAAPSREAILTTIKLNPGHAVFYRVD